ncbi:hypothetical protein DAPPUDRAFT_115817 [Daphnia pulex]|uniref:JmjC domain-containing protein n=1 Tax=Daphnia pulex TaxID=6669 RepID=E9HMM5_DAPPU|nr:hypothetical protein DAPPUDRAFT_115817 [Daphnia pulex]|eukprot:EFX66993.1 hypothetical protein DAPPUDRAFT_115817 [Daphnia pulex]
MTALKSTFADIQVYPNEAIKGINTPQLLIGQVYTYTPFHVEDENFASLNFVHKGARKIWILVPESSREAVEKLFEKEYPESYRICRAAHLHKQFLTFPHVLQTAVPPIPFQINLQGPGDCVATWPGAYHMVINLGSNTAEAINYTLPVFTEKYCGKPTRCNCPGRKKIDHLRLKFKFNLPGQDEPEPLLHPSDAQPGPSGNASTASAADHDGGDVCATEPLSHPSDAQPGPSGNASAASAADHEGGECSSRGSRGGRGRGGRGRPRARARVSGRGFHREEEQVTSSSPPLGMSEKIPRRLRPRKVVNYNYMLEIDSE